MPVVLGWVADPAGAPAPPQGSADLVGWLQPPEGTGAVDDDPGDDVLPQLRIADLVQHVDQDLYGGYAVAQQGVGRAARRRPGRSSRTPAGSPRSATSSTRSSGGSSAAFAVLIWWRWVGEQLAPDPDAPTEEDEDQPDTVKT